MHALVHTYVCAQVVKPSLEEIQTVVNDAVSEVTSIGRFISVWADYEPQGGEDLLFTPRSEGSSNVHYGVLQGEGLYTLLQQRYLSITFYSS